ncbi:GNAT family N-acetyltransferase [Candidatus Albibeggiatoa sp. nov. NOAA]|uniref:GNAT family N-acetyltransferase n=1 Tax=Candidatus Albibeggiatoa sp. nov. NOAA TaxID=3162724 RepID=UPI00330518C7|nr:GNAT family N-acetyltransferase [Thiotrichaceae bacterium]
MQITIHQIDFDTGFADIQFIRETVFIQEQKIPPELEWDEFDPHATHIIARVKEQAVGTARLLDNGSIGRVAVLKPFRKKGVGRKMMHYLMDLAKQHNCSNVQIHAQVVALAFYQKLGFITVGDIFDEAGIPHQTAFCYF